MTDTNDHPKKDPPVFSLFDIKTSPYIPKGFGVAIGNTCKACGKPYEPLTLCPENFPNGHIPDITILKLEEITKEEEEK